MMLASLAMVAGLQLVHLAAGTPQQACELYSVCADCTCSTYSYSVSDACVPGCAWLPDTGACVNNATAVASGQPAFYTLWRLAKFVPAATEDDRKLWLSKGATTCRIGHAPGVVATIIASCMVGALLCAVLVAFHCKTKQVTKPLQDAPMWLFNLLDEYILDGDAIVWKGASTKLQKRGGSDAHWTGLGYVCSDMLVLLVTTVPSIVWLFIGLPTTVTGASTWAFAFFYPICFCSGIAVILGAILLGINWSTIRGTSLQAVYAITNNHAVIVIGDRASKSIGKHGATKVVNMGMVTYVTQNGGTCVTFGARPATAVADEARTDTKARQSETGSTLVAGPPTVVKFDHLHEAEARVLCRMLRARCSDRTVALGHARDGPVVVGVPVKADYGATPPPPSRSPIHSATTQASVNGAGDGTPHAGHDATQPLLRSVV